MHFYFRVISLREGWHSKCEYVLKYNSIDTILFRKLYDIGSKKIEIDIGYLINFVVESMM